jgi:hypothetical protein
MGNILSAERITISPKGDSMKLNYFWTDCADGSHVAVNYTVYEDRVSGSLRRWSPDASVNEGRKFEVPAAELSRDDRGRRILSLDAAGAGKLEIPIDSSALAEARMN